MQERAAKSGMTGRRWTACLTRCAREVGELVEAESDAHRAEELGDLPFVLTNVGRKTGIEVEAALRSANDKFRRRFRHASLPPGRRGGRPRHDLRRRAGRAVDAAKAAEREEASS
ncbi:MAG: MazG nucleotide pyrophosphohydrolase domain-containing protein [Chloroflexota bacterium]